MNKETLSWQDLESLTKMVLIKIKLDNWFPDIIVGLTRGGLLPAKMLSHALGCEMSALDVSLRDSNFIGPTTSWIPTIIADGKKILVVDDINDSGATFEWIRQDWTSTLRLKDNEQWPMEYIKFAALLHNSPSSQPTDYYGRLINKDSDPIWIEFPYEVWHKTGRH